MSANTNTTDKIDKRFRRSSDVTREQILSRLVSDPMLTYESLGRELGISRQRVHQMVGALCRLHPRLRPYGVRRPVQEMKAKSVLSEIESRIRKGESRAGVCKELGLSVSTVGRMIKVKSLCPPQRTQHGNISAYNHGCRCEQCVAAGRRHSQECYEKRKQRKKEALK